MKASIFRQHGGPEVFEYTDVPEPRIRASEVLVEVKTVERLTEAHNRQLVNYLKATGLEVGLLLNFGPEPQFIRRVNSDDKSRSLRDQSAKTASSADSGPETIRNANNDA